MNTASLVTTLRSIAGTCVALLSLTGGSAQAAYPDKPINVVVNSEAAGPVDLLARVLRDDMSRALGQNLIIENRLGAGGVVGAGYVAQGPSDGYRILVSGAGPLVLAPVLYKGTVPYNTLEAFRAVNVSIEVAVFMAGTLSMPANNLKDYVAYTKTQPGKLSYGTAGIGTPAHLMSELFKKVTGADLTFVPYQGSPAAMLALMRGEITMHVVTPAVALPLYEGNRIRLLAVSGTKRLPKAPQVPTFAEAGYPEVEVPAWFGFFVPKNTPNDVVEALDGAVKKALANPKAQETLANGNFVIRSLGGADGDRFLRSESEKWSRVIQEANIKVQ